MKYSTVFAQAYSDSGYGECAYGADHSSQACTTTVNNVDRNAVPYTSGLSNATIIWLAFLVVICLAICIGLIVRVWRRQPVVQEIEEIEDKRFSDRY